MTPERWQRVKDILGTALQMQPAERAAYLEKACGADPSLRAAVDRLLVAEEEAGPEFSLLRVRHVGVEVTQQ